MSNEQMKRIVILGAGESGTGAAILAKKQGFDLFVSDLAAVKPKYRQLLEEHDIAWEEGRHTESLILNADEVIKSPGIPDKASIVEKLRKKGVPVISEIEFAGRYTDAKMICITGSNGKTTTTMLIYHILKGAGLDVGLAGNVGQSLALQVALCPHEYYVVELSSFQLDGMTDFKADVAVLLNITPDHLDRYDYKFQNYVDSKFRITRNQTEKDVFIYPENDPVIKAELAKHHIHSSLYPFALERGEKTRAFIEGEQLVVRTLGSIFSMPVAELALPGMHNACNSMASGLAASVLDVKKDVIRESLKDFHPVEHRLEYVATVKNVRYFNDSKATNVNSCWYALSSINTPIVLILGGTDKGNDYAEIEELVYEKVRALIFLGKDNTPLHRFFGKKGKQIADTHSMDEAVKAAYKLALEGDTVLLSPCCASFDLFENYEDRGRQFKECVKRL